jgi:hypothetical protein
MASLYEPSTFGSDPAVVKWQVVRGDTANIRVEFLETDEKTFVSTSGWEYTASAYDPKTDTIDELEVVAGNGYVEITASPDITKMWGAGYRSVVAELLFDVQVTKSDGTVWTPVVGTIAVLGDVTYGGSL